MNASCQPQYFVSHLCMFYMGNFNSGFVLVLPSGNQELSTSDSHLKTCIHNILIFSCHCVQSLCNACGIKYRKKRREALGLESGGVKKENRSREESEAGEKKSKSSSSNNSKGVSLKLKMVGLEGEVVINKKKRKMVMKMGEEERAAILLMALSSGCVHG
jgi:hypothetical protein